MLTDVIFTSLFVLGIASNVTCIDGICGVGYKVENTCQKICGQVFFINIFSFLKCARNLLELIRLKSKIKLFLLLKKYYIKVSLIMQLVTYAYICNIKFVASKNACQSKIFCLNFWF